MASGKGRQLAQCTLSIQIILAGEFYFYCQYYFSTRTQLLSSIQFEKAEKICSRNKLNGKFRPIFMAFSKHMSFEQPIFKNFTVFFWRRCYVLRLMWQFFKFSNDSKIDKNGFNMQSSPTLNVLCPKMITLLWKSLQTCPKDMTIFFFFFCCLCHLCHFASERSCVFFTLSSTRGDSSGSVR